MTAIEAKKKLAVIAEVLLEEENDFLSLKKALEDYKELLLTLSGLDYDDKLNEENIPTRAGEAIGPKWAGMCLEDLARTKAFVRGIYRAVEEKKEKNEDKAVLILYTGTGPFATLVLPLIAIYEPQEVQFLLLEINPRSVASLKRVISGLDATAYVKGVYQADALRFKIPDAHLVDIVIIECLQRALDTEPQVAISYHLIPQLKENVILIPEQLSLHIASINVDEMVKGIQDKSEKNHMDCYQNSNPVLVLNKETIGRKIAGNSSDIFDFDQKLVLFDTEDFLDKDGVAITTEITVHKDEKLTLNQSGLTVPKFLTYLQAGETLRGVQTKYVVSKSPGLQTKLLR